MIGGEKDRIKKGDFFIIDAGVYHEYTPDKDMPLVVYNCIFYSEAIDSEIERTADFLEVAYRYLFHSFYSQEGPGRYIKLTGGRTSKLLNLLHDMYKEYEAKENGYMQMLRADLQKLLILAFRLYKADKSQIKNGPILEKLVVENSLQYLQSEYASSITAELLAQRCYVSNSTFNRVFKEATGKSAAKYLQDIRMYHACRLLRDTDLPASQVGLNVGYSDNKHFYSLFRQQTGMTPGAYREIHRINEILPKKKNKKA